MTTIEKIKKGEKLLYATLFLPAAEVFYIRQNPQYAERDIELYEQCKKIGKLYAWDRLKQFRSKAILAA